MDKRKEILEQFHKFNEYLDSIDLKELKDNYTRAELNQFKDELYNLKTRSLAYEISKMVEEIKKEEFPELLGIHHFPILKNIDFLTYEEKKKVDEFLINFRKGNYVSGFWRVIDSDDKIKKLEDYLLNNGILEERFRLSCPRCSDEYLSGMLSLEEKNKVEDIFNENSGWEKYEELEKYIYFYSDECGYEVDLDKDFPREYERSLKMIGERDKSLDNV